ncbi:hypothetical protein Vafri_19185, partial [Volvox africanus]
LSKVVSAKLSSNDVQLAEVLNSDLLVKLVTLLGRSADSVLVAVNTMEPCYTKPFNPEGLGYMQSRCAEQRISITLPLSAYLYVFPPHQLLHRSCHAQAHQHLQALQRSRRQGYQQLQLRGNCRPQVGHHLPCDKSKAAHILNWTWSTSPLAIGATGC